MRMKDLVKNCDRSLLHDEGEEKRAEETIDVFCVFIDV